MYLYVCTYEYREREAAINKKDVSGRQVHSYPRECSTPNFKPRKLSPETPDPNHQPLNPKRCAATNQKDVVHRQFYSQTLKL